MRKERIFICLLLLEGRIAIGGNGGKGALAFFEKRGPGRRDESS